MFSILFYMIFSPLIPMIFLFVKYFEKGSNKIGISLIMLAVCAASVFLGEFYADHVHGLEGMRALAAIYGGLGGIVLSLAVLIISVIMKIRH